MHACICVCVCVHACMCVCMHACVRACVHMCMRVSVCGGDGGEQRLFLGWVSSGHTSSCGGGDRQFYLQWWIQ